MFDKKKFKDRVKTCGLSIGDVSCKLGIDQATLYRKMNGVSDFTRFEIQVLRDVLQLTVEEAEDIFFADRSA